MKWKSLILSLLCLSIGHGQDVRQLSHADIADLEVVDASGSKHSFREFSGRTHVVILIRGAFCKLCMEQLSEFQTRLGPSKVPVVVITPVNDLPALSGVPFSVFASRDYSVFRKLNAFKTEPLHATYVFGARGNVMLKDIGEQPFTDFAAIEKVLKGDPITERRK